MLSSDVRTCKVAVRFHGAALLTLDVRKRMVDVRKGYRVALLTSDGRKRKVDARAPGMLWLRWTYGKVKST